ncbi:MAG: hypothetical protein RLZZ414_2206 [Bacteroidota bacterium]|jgi:hypothetical protein
MNKISTSVNLSQPKLAKPSQKSIDFLINFSKSIEVVKEKKSKLLLCKN